MPPKARIGELLVNKGLITEEQLKNALTIQKERGGRLGSIFVDLGYISYEIFLKVLSEQLGVPFVDVTHHKFNSDLVKKLPESYARRYRAIVLDDNGIELTVGMVDPQDIFAFGEVSRILQRPIKQVLVEEATLSRVIDNIYRHTDQITDYAKELSDEITKSVEVFLPQLDIERNEDAPVVKLLQSLFEDAVQVNASDIHIEPDEKILRIRTRVDGFLQEQIVENRHIISALTQRLKLMAGLDIAEKRLPQDGRFNIKVHDSTIDIRLSTLPVQNGESVVMRLLNQDMAHLSLRELGMPTWISERFRKLINRTHGMVLVTGPTGSGKTTTLYSALQELNRPETKIITVEDPVEYQIPRINQVQVNRKIDLTFSRVLRAALRQDPDIVLVGEIRDSETASIALRAAMTGHLVLATLHTNDARSSAMRLVDMGVEGYLVAVALRAVLAQRLVRRICESCRQQREISPRETNWVKVVAGNAMLERTFYEGAGCTQCNNSGYAGRVGVYELLELNAPMMDALRDNNTNQFYRAVEKHPNAIPLGLMALDLALTGMTTLEEVIRIAEELEDAPDIVASTNLQDE